MANWPPDIKFQWPIQNFSGLEIISGRLRNLICKSKTYFFTFVYLCNSQCLPNYQTDPPVFQLGIENGGARLWKKGT
jgi:hypothetical protein